MNDREFEKQKRRVVRVFDWWRDKLWLQWWRVDFEWYRGPFNVSRDRNADRDSVISMETHAWWQYARAFIKVNLEAIADLDDKDLTELVAHECQHIILNEMRWWGENHDHEERVATHLARAFITVRGKK